MHLLSSMTTLLYPMRLRMWNHQGLLRILNRGRGMITEVRLRIMRTWKNMAIIGIQTTVIIPIHIMKGGYQNIVNLCHIVRSQSRSHVLSRQNTIPIRERTVINMSIPTGKEDMSNMIETVTIPEVRVTPMSANNTRCGRTIGREILTGVQTPGNMILITSTIASQILTNVTILVCQCTRKTTLLGTTTKTDEHINHIMKITVHHIERLTDVTDLQFKMGRGKTLAQTKKVPLGTYLRINVGTQCLNTQYETHLCNQYQTTHHQNSGDNQLLICFSVVGACLGKTNHNLTRRRPIGPISTTKIRTTTLIAPTGSSNRELALLSHPIMLIGRLTT